MIEYPPKHPKATDYIAMWDCFTPHIDSQRERNGFEGICHMRECIAMFTDNLHGMFEFFSPMTYDRMAFDSEWCGAAIETLLDYKQNNIHLDNATIRWDQLLIAGLKTVRYATQSPLNDTQLWDLKYDWHAGPRTLHANCVEPCEPAEALFYGVYGRLHSGLAEWIADVRDPSDADLLVAALERLYPAT